jgi:ATP-dependent protease HslVU (ClpYQ) ATPase subunit
LELVVNEVSLNVHRYKGKVVVVDRDDVQELMTEFQDKVELKKYIL